MSRSVLVGLVLLLIGSSGCLRLDDFLFNAQKLESYELDQYTGEVDFTLPPELDIPDSLIHFVPLTSYAGDRPVTIQGLLVGSLDHFVQDTFLLYCHGNKHHLDFYWPRIELLANLGRNGGMQVMSFDYQGYGRSDGEPSQASLYQDARAAWNWLIDQGVTPDRIILYGFSMGSIPAVHLAATPEQTGRGWLILEAPLSSSETLVQEASTLSLPASFLTDLDFDNAVEITGVSQPLLWLHGENDQSTPIHTHGEPVFQAYKGSRSTAIRVPLAGHANLPQTLGFQDYLQAISSFLKG